MVPIEKFTIQVHSGAYEDRPLKSSLYFCGEDVNVKISGYVIEKQFELPDYYLLLVNWDCPFEEGCEIIVLNKRLEYVGDYSFTPFYCSYILSDFSELSENRYKLVFNNSNFFEVFVNYPKKHILGRVVKVKKMVG